MVKTCRKCEKKTIEVMSYMTGEVWVEIHEPDRNNCPSYIILAADGVEQLIRELREKMRHEG